MNAFDKVIGYKATKRELLQLCDMLQTYFNPRPPRGGRLSAQRTAVHIVTFQSTPPARGATSARRHPRGIRKISIHAPREGGDLRRGSDHHPVQYFNPRPPRGGRHRDFKSMDKRVVISIHAPREGGDRLYCYFCRYICLISIHAPREGGDTEIARCGWSRGYFNPRPPRGGRRIGAGMDNNRLTFQSTPPARGATTTFRMGCSMDL